MNRINIIWIRHGATPGNRLSRYIGRTDEAILPEEYERLSGVKDVLEEVCPFSVRDIDTVYASPMIRCQETASIVFPAKRIVSVHDLRECDFGKFENKNYIEMDGDEDYQRWVDSGGTLPFPEGESMEIHRERSCEGFRSVIYSCIDEHRCAAAMSVHGGTIMSIFSVMAEPGRSYYGWHVGNGEGFFTWVDADAFAAGDEVIHVIGSF